MGRKKTELNLQAELPEVRSTDFNLFYRPEVAPIDKSIDIFTKSIDNFVNNAGTAMVLNAEKKEKEVSEAEALKQFNDNRTGFNDAVKRGEIPKEANPYFQEKYKELTLNKKAMEFQAEVYRNYAEKNVLDNPDPNAFDKFYNDELKNFLTENNLGVFDALQLEKGFFSETSKTRNSLFNTHVNSQMSKIGEDYKNNFKESIQGKFDKNRSNEDIGADISGFIQDAVKNGLGKSTAQKYLLESLTDWSKTTGDLEFAERLLRDLPNHLNLSGLGALSNVKGLQNDLDALKENIDTRILQKEKDDNTKLQLQESNDKLEASDFANKYDTFSEAILDPEYQNFSNNKKAEIFKEYEVREQDFDSQTDPRVEEDFYKLLEENKIPEAKEFLRKNIPNMTSNKYSEFDKELKAFQFTKKDGLLASGYYNYWKNEIEGITKSTNKGKFALSKIDPLEHKKFEANMKVWLADNKIEDFNNNNTLRKEAFEKYVKSEYDKVLEKAINSDETSLSDGAINVDGENSTPTIEGGKKKKIKATKEDLTGKVEPKVKKKNINTRGGAKPENRATDPELEIDLAKLIIIPNNISKGERVKIKRDNPNNTISQDEYDRIFKKQNDLQLAKGN
jgi:hypothetical protein